MPFNPGEITKDHVLQAVKKIRNESIKLSPSIGYDVVIQGELYPPKEIMRYAHQAMNGELLWKPSGGEPTNKFLRKLGFEIVEKRDWSAAINKYIALYKQLISNELEGATYDELYKWETIAHFQKHWSDHFDETGILQNIDSAFIKDNNNLWSGSHYLPLKMLKQFGQQRPKKVGELFSKLFNEKEDLNGRLIQFETGFDNLLEELRPGENISHYQSRRSMVLYLCLRYPSQYYLYKNGMFNDFCALTKLWSPFGKAKKKDHAVLENYFEMCDSVRSVLIQDRELIALHEKVIPSEARIDDDYHLLTQDFIYAVAVTMNPAKWKQNPENNVAEKQPNTSENNMPLNQILYGPPGTGKTYNTLNKTIQIIDPDYFEKHQGDREKLKMRYDELKEKGQIVFTTFHQSLSYEDFVEGIKPESDDGGNIKYDVQPGLFKHLVQKAKEGVVVGENFETTYGKLLKKIKENGGSLILETTEQANEFTIYENTKGNLKFHANTEKRYEAVLRKDYLRIFLETGESKDWASYMKGVGKYMVEELGYSKQVKDLNQKYVLIIDEINRGNVSQIFGELITLIEDDKRLGRKEALQVKLPYSKELFGVPSNVHIIGTMNTADRSVEALDTALRRRFSFVEMDPDPALLNEPEHRSEEIDLAAMLTAINTRLEKLLDKDYCIGHSYFLGMNKELTTEENLRNIFQNKILPLLQEYFYGDWGKIAMVIGDDFVDKKTEGVKFMSDYDDADEYLDKPTYTLTKPEEWSLDSFKKMYGE